MSETRSAVDSIRKILPYTSVACVLAVLYVAYVFYARWDEHHRAAEAAAEREAEIARKNFELNGAGQLKVTFIYANPPAIPRGGQGQICYGVVNATKVKIEPGVEHVWPSLSKCVDIQPKVTTKYTLTAADDAGHAVTNTVDVTVR